MKEWECHLPWEDNRCISVLIIKWLLIRMSFLWTRQNMRQEIWWTNPPRRVIQAIKFTKLPIPEVSTQTEQDLSCWATPDPALMTKQWCTQEWALPSTLTSRDTLTPKVEAKFHLTEEPQEDRDTQAAPTMEWKTAWRSHTGRKSTPSWFWRKTRSRESRKEMLTVLSSNETPPKTNESERKKHW